MGLQAQGVDRMVLQLVLDLRARVRALEALCGRENRAPRRGPGLGADVVRITEGKRTTIRDLALQVCTERCVPIAELMSDARRAQVAHARQEVMRLAVDAGFSTTQVGRFLGRDHSTVVHGIKAARARLAGRGGA